MCAACCATDSSLPGRETRIHIRCAGAGREIKETPPEYLEMQLSSRDRMGFDPFFSPWHHPRLCDVAGPSRPARFCICLCVFNSPVSVYLNADIFLLRSALPVCLFWAWTERLSFFALPAFRAVCAHKEKEKHSSITGRPLGWLTTHSPASSIQIKCMWEGAAAVWCADGESRDSGERKSKELLSFSCCAVGRFVEMASGRMRAPFRIPAIHRPVSYVLVRSVSSGFLLLSLFGFFF